MNGDNIINIQPNIILNILLNTQINILFLYSQQFLCLLNQVLECLRELVADFLDRENQDAILPFHLLHGKGTPSFRAGRNCRSIPFLLVIFYFFCKYTFFSLISKGFMGCRFSHIWLILSFPRFPAELSASMPRHSEIRRG